MSPSWKILVRVLVLIVAQDVSLESIDIGLCGQLISKENADAFVHVHV
jgi:hypothetical protein